MNEEKNIQLFQWIVAIASGLLIVFLLTAWIVSGPAQEWKRLQRDYFDLAAALDTADGLAVQYFARKGIHQVEIADLNRTDRCVTCHMGVEDPRMEGASQPFAAHPPGFFDDHPPDEYGCTICHGGQGRAMNSREAHGIALDTHWEHPLRMGDQIQSSCGQCHLAIFSGNSEFEHTDVFRQGQEIFNREGCLGCHKARGVGGIIGPDLTEQGEKTRHEYSFQHITLEPTIANWMKEHFRDPEMVSPGSQMLKIDLPEEELDALTTFVLGLAKPDIAFNYFSLETLNEFKGNRASLEGHRAFSMACSGCHGREGLGKSYETFDMGTPALRGKDFLRVVSGDYIDFTLLKGRSRRDMASWMSTISGLHDHELEDLRNFLLADVQKTGKTLDRQAVDRADRSKGRSLYTRSCATCHGTDGTGGLAVALNQPDFLSYADDRFLYQTLVTGRKNATMPSWQHLPPGELYALVSYMRSWHPYHAPTSGEAFIPSPAGKMSQPGGQAQAFTPGFTDNVYDTIAVSRGRLTYHFMCSRCHGEHGQGQTGPAIINEGFLQVATDDFLYRTIAFGRSHTAMFGWSKDVFNAERLSSQDIKDLVAFLRREALSSPEYIYAGRNPGDKTRGKPLYHKHCADCHGVSGEGDKAPALNNQELLSAASNGYLVATVTVGRGGTEMPEWGIAGDGRPALSAGERQDIVAWIRDWQRIKIGF